MVTIDANRLRALTIRMISESGSGHPGGALSAADILAGLYGKWLNYDPDQPDWEDRDRFILSKGHSAPALYAVLAEAGFIDPQILMSYRRLGSPLQGHPDCRKLPGVEISTGSLGQGLSVGIGMALAARLAGKAYTTYVMLGDGEIQEGQVWEGAMAAPHFCLGNLTAIIDCNGLQIDGPTCDVMGVDPLEDKWKAFGWRTAVIDGHDPIQIDEALALSKEPAEKPLAIIALTKKGKGVSFLEDKVSSHHAKGFSAEELEMALDELGVALSW